MHRLGVNKLKAVSKSVPLANYRVNRQRAAGKREIQYHILPQGRFDWQHGRDPRFANVHGTALQHAARSGLDSDIDFNFEPGLATEVGSKRGDSELLVSGPFLFAPLVDPIRERDHSNHREYVGLLHAAAFLR
ncbi:MAG TPA: hypothetical protein VN901_20565 [Candidatus Acidoferrales bacterium]|nr:hypothetical protein [Candidatus Acidoferrales bacterium]